ncbi:hypothetical protein ACFV27_00310 [Streptomyces antimycoticus]|uniref:hypothetical protein n=1 Tax=Streptomyces antimycoticus TaxID=68175 RepID=UPI0036B76E32
MTMVKLVAIVIFLAIGVTHIDAADWSPFIPASQPVGGNGDMWEQPLLGRAGLGADATFGMAGILTGGAIIFGAYSGFDIMASNGPSAQQGGHG